MVNFINKYAGATLVSMLLMLTARAMIHGRFLETIIYMVSTFLALILAYAYH